jgi:hypothetical protein
MENLQVRVTLGNGIAVYDDYSPNLESLVIYQLLSERGLASSNPTVQEITDNMAKLQGLIPIKQDETHGFFYCSNPVYTYISEERHQFRKRWESDNKYINWGKRKAKVETSQGAEKNYDLPLFLRLTPFIDWYCVGDKTELLRILNQVTGLGKKRSHGFGQVIEWKVTEIENDWSLVKDGELMKPVNGKVFINLGISRFYNVLTWGWKPPGWLSVNKELCMMPEVVKRAT